MLFRMFAASAHGKKYLERGLPCQDVSDTLEFDGVQAIAVADGHGGKDYFRSDTGARLAVEIAFAQVKKFCSELSADEIFSDNGIKIFEHSVWNAWREAVMNHWRENPVTDAEFRWQTVSEKYKARFTSTDEKILAKYIPVAYGTTLLCAISIGAQVLITQIGDGTCVVLQRNGEFKIPVPPDSENILNVVTSLCDSDAVSKFRHVVLNCDENFPLAPVAIFLSSDGLDDCYPVFENEKYLYKLYGETIIDGLIDSGFETTEREIRDELLPYMTERGSNDDISLAYLVTEDLNLLKAAVEKNSQPATADTEKISTPVIIDAEKISQPATIDAKKISPPATVGNVAEKISTPATIDNVTEKISQPATIDAKKISPPVTADNVTKKFSPPATVDNVAEKISQPATADNVTEKISTPATIDNVTEKISQPATIDAKKISPLATVDNVTKKFSPPVTADNVTKKFSPPAAVNAEKNSPPVTADNVTKKFSPTPIVNIEPKNLTPPANVTPQNFSPVIRKENVTWLPPVKIGTKPQSERSDNHEQP